MAYKRSINEFKLANGYFDKLFDMKNEEQCCISKEELKDLLSNYKKEAEEAENEYGKVLHRHYLSSKRFAKSHENYVQKTEKLLSLVSKVGDIEEGGEA